MNASSTELKKGKRLIIIIIIIFLQSSKFRDYVFTINNP